MRRIGGDTFEDNLSEYLEGAEMAPSDNVWNSIDAELANLESVKLRKQVALYRKVAAGLLILLVSSLLLAWQLPFLFRPSYSGTAAGAFVADHPTTQYSQEFELGLNDLNWLRQSSNIRKSEGSRSINRNSTPTFSSTNSNLNSWVVLASTSDWDGHGRNDANFDLESQHATSALLSRELSFRSLSEGDRLGAPVQESPDYIQKILVYDLSFKEKKNDLIASNAKSWADFNVRGGLFEPNYQRSGGGVSAFASAAPATNNGNLLQRRRSAPVEEDVLDGEDLTAGYSYTFSMNYGKRLTRRLFVQSGLEYGIYDAVSSTNRVLSNGRESLVAATEQIITNSDLNIEDANLEVGFENVELNNSFQFASIPVRVGYVLFDKRLNFSVTGGVSTGFYLGNTISDPDEILEDVNVSPGQGSLYRSINFNAVGGITVGYRLKEDFIITVEPAYQRALGSYTRNASGFTALPENFGVSAGLRFLIN